MLQGRHWQFCCHKAYRKLKGIHLEVWNINKSALNHQICQSFAMPQFHTIQCIPSYVHFRTMYVHVSLCNPIAKRYAHPWNPLVYNCPVHRIMYLYYGFCCHNIVFSICGNCIHNHSYIYLICVACMCSTYYLSCRMQ